MCNKKKKGAALIIVIVVVTVMVILGATVLEIGLGEVKQAAHEDKRLQAHYLARSGAEATLKAWEDPKNTVKPIGKCQTVYMDSTNQFGYSPSAKMIGKFDVEVTINGDDTIIKSVGTVGGVAQTVTATIKAETTTVQVPADIINGDALNWYHYESGQINTGNKGNIGPKQPCPKGKKVKLEAQGGKGLKLPNKNSPAVEFESEQLLFFSTLQILHNDITTVSKLVAFKQVDQFTNNNGSGSLTLKILDNGYSPINEPIGEGNWGVVFFGEDGYYFKDIPDGVVLQYEADIQSQVIAGNLVRITDPTLKNPCIYGYSKSITTYSIIWS